MALAVCRTSSDSLYPKHRRPFLLHARKCSHASCTESRDRALCIHNTTLGASAAGAAFQKRTSHFLRILVCSGTVFPQLTRGRPRGRASPAWAGEAHP